MYTGLNNEIKITNYMTNPFPQQSNYATHEQDTFNNHYYHSASPLQQMNQRIASTTEQILNHRLGYKYSLNHNHKFIKPQSSKNSHKTYERLQSPKSSVHKYNSGCQQTYYGLDSKKHPVISVKGRKSPVKINFLYDPAQKPQVDIVRNQATTTSYIMPKNYESTDLILPRNHDSYSRKSALKREVKFSYATQDNDLREQKLSSKSSISYVNRYNKELPHEQYERHSSRSKIFKRPTSEQNLGIWENINHRPEQTTSYYYDLNDFKPKMESEEKDVFYEMNDNKSQKVGGNSNGFYDTNSYKQAKSSTTKIQNPKGKVSKRNSDKSQQLIKSKQLIGSTIKSKQAVQQDVKSKVQIVETTQLSAEKKPSAFFTLIGQLKDKQSQLISGVLIILAVIIFLLQLIF